ncbi:hypothetical protein C7S18_05415 [Ahniella affigens]|uniref:Uncharacterized protein n=1 Tax=Ahniella affigens TaxID=2021234 RepID=A0A2P1PPB7_9GAMM|nr:hypothetical protein [Ahniella affigens]AVP96675.1 hypothetical protein C7S18_05415 [Ahniella affigens]
MPRLNLLSGLCGLLLSAVCLAQSWTVPTAIESRLLDAGNDAHSGQNVGVALAFDGEWLAVGASTATVDGRSNQGVVYLYRRVGDHFLVTQRLAQSDGQSGDLFGSALALRNGRLIVGAPGTDIGADANRGRAVVYMLQNEWFVESTRVTAASTDADDRFGSALAFDGQMLVIGAPYASVGGTNNVGAAFAFRFNGGTFQTPQRLEPTSRVNGDSFGWSVALSGNTVAVGAPLADGGGLTDCGAVSVYVDSGSSFSLQQTLQMTGRDQQDWFGWSIALNGDRLYVGAPFDDWATVDRGSVQPFTRSGSVWSGGALIQASDGATSDLFGYAVNTDGTDLVIGARADQVTLGTQGSVYHYRIQPSFAYQGKLVDPDPGSDDMFGNTLALSAGSLAVSARLDDVVGVADTGSVSVFEIGLQTPVWKAKLSATYPIPGSDFGRVIAASGDHAFVGMPSATRATAGATGAVDWYRRQPDGSWLFAQRFVASDGQAGDAFGAALTLAGDTLVIGAPNASPLNQSAAGGVYLLRPQGNGYTLSGRFDAASAQSGAQFGAALSASGNQVLIGVPGAIVDGQSSRGSVVVAEVMGTSLVLRQTVIDPNGAAGDRFGKTLAHAVAGAAIGAPMADVNGQVDAGKVLLFARNQNDFTLTQTHVAEVPQAHAHFGASLASSWRVLAIGAPDADVAGLVDQGQLSWLDWSAPTALRTLADSHEPAGAHFAAGLAVHSGMILAASPLATVGESVGAGRVNNYLSNGAELVKIGELVAAAPETGAAFGSGLFLDGNRAFVGSPFTDRVDTHSGLLFPDVGSVQIFDPDVEVVLTLGNGRDQVIQGLSDLSQLLIANVGMHPAAGVSIQAPAPTGLSSVLWSCTGLQGAACPSSPADDLLDAVVDLAPGAGVLFERLGQVDLAAGQTLESLASTNIIGASSDDPANNSAADRDAVVLDVLLRDSFESD